MMANLPCFMEISGNNGTVFNDGPVSVVNNGTIPLTNNSFVNGTSISHTPGSDSIFLSPTSKTYLVYYKCTGVGTTAGQLLLNGTAVSGSSMAIVPNGGAQCAISACVILNTTPSFNPNILKLQNTSGATKTFTQVAITIFRLT